MKEMIIFDLDGTLVDLCIDRDDFETCRSFWASHLTERGVPTTLKPIWPELQRVSRTPVGQAIRLDILRSLDRLELEGCYDCLGRIDAVLDAAKAQCKKLVLVTHNGRAFWEHLAHEQLWSDRFDVVITRDDMACFKPDPLACEAVLQDLAMSPDASECWVIGNADVDRGLGINLRQRYPHLVVRTFLVDPTCAEKTSAMNELDIDVPSIDEIGRAHV